MIKRDQIEKEIKELELQLKLKRKELRSLGRKPGKRGGSWFLQNPQDWDKVFKDFEKLSIQVERKSKVSSLKPDSLSVFGFKESCEKHGYLGVTSLNILQIKSNELQDSKKKFFIRFKKSVKQIIEGRNKIREQLDNEKWKLFESQMKEHNGDIKKVDRSLGRYIRRVFGFNNKRVKDLRREYRIKNWNEFSKECKIRYSDFRSLGLKVNNSLYLSGIGNIRSKDRESVYFLNEEKEFHQKIMKEHKLNHSLDFSEKTWDHFNKQKEYIELLKKISSTYKFQKGWDTGTNRKQWNITDIHFQKPDYRRIFNERIEVTINRETTELERIEKLVIKNEKRGITKGIEKVKIKKKQKEVKSRWKESNKKLSPYKYPSKEDIVNDPDFFISLEKILRRLKIYNLGYDNKELYEQVGCSPWMWKTGVIQNKDLRKTYDLLIDKLRSENLVKQLKSIDNKYSDLIVRSSEDGKIFYDIKNDVVVMDCNFCGDTKSKENFPSYNIKTKNYKCFSCIKGESGKSRPGEKYKGKIIKKYDSRDVVTHNRCTSCDEFKLKKKFNYRWRGSSVCDDCYVELPNNHLTRKGEFNSKGDRLRIYNSNFNVTHKRCNTCFDMKELEYFHNQMSSKIDGRKGTCKGCLNKSRKELV